ncbi:MAG: tRNA uridine-5-carboxymethylaminomethyl(34) synthesis enzyme MnmG [candidate division Zixibacteria bacterium RBG_16_53_22]|nr:MAG: tRNA uridine-5-carboxymethylaminomethyl(34) synthesis enzyme MnmG [candidate division Zixibacteria bacterium RBG_16_53_22]
MKNEFDFDIVVIGGGHAGIEAALAGARMGCRTAMITMSRQAIGRMSCNPAIGGLAKGQLVKEIDALGGEMGYATDLAGIQFRMLNRSKGPAVQSRRAQCDRALYSELMIAAISGQANLEIIEGEVIDLIIYESRCQGVTLAGGQKIASQTVIITAGTFLNGLIYRGLERIPAGRIDEAPAIGLSQRLQSLGVQTGRLKTGTPPRLDGNTIDFSNCQAQPGDTPPPFFSNRTDPSRHVEQIFCHLTYTNEDTHRIIRDNLHLSPMYSGAIKGIGPRYCPSIEDKVVRFAEKPRHQLFLEPEGMRISEYYLNGFSSSLPAETQLAALHTIPGLEQVEMTRPGYAIEYDFFPPHQVYATMESKVIPNLYFAGQVNGTSGYEEAAAQGIVAGINAASKVRHEPEFRLSRSEAYIGVLIDDLVTKSTTEPYRMFTSRAEYRLNLRDDNAEERVLEKGRQLGLIGDHIYHQFIHRQKLRGELVARLKSEKIALDDNGDGLQRRVSAYEALRNPRLEIGAFSIYNEASDQYGQRILCDLINEVRYEGYIIRQDRRVERMRRLESHRIPWGLDFGRLKGLKKEAAQKLSHFKPETLGQASRISGVTPGDITILMVHLGRTR